MMEYVALQKNVASLIVVTRHHEVQEITNLKSHFLAALEIVNVLY